MQHSGYIGRSEIKGPIQVIASKVKLRKNIYESGKNRKELDELLERMLVKNTEVEIVTKN